MDKQINLPHNEHVAHFYSLIESDKHEEGRVYFRRYTEEITGWEVKHFQQYKTEHANRISHHVEFNKSFPRSSKRLVNK